MLVKTTKRLIDRTAEASIVIPNECSTCVCVFVRLSVVHQVHSDFYILPIPLQSLYYKPIS